MNYDKRNFYRSVATTIKKGDVITLDGGTGEVFLGEVKTMEPKLSGEFAELMALADKHRKLGIFTNADTPKDAKVARKFGAEGIGLCRTEHMFFDADRIDAVREMIVAENKEDRKKALAKILPMQKGDFKQLFEVMKGSPLLLDFLIPHFMNFCLRQMLKLQILRRNWISILIVSKQKLNLFTKLIPCSVIGVVDLPLRSQKFM